MNGLEGAMHIHNPKPEFVRAGRVKDLFNNIHGNEKFRTRCCGEKKKIKELVAVQRCYEYYEPHVLFFCSTACEGDAE